MQDIYFSHPLKFVSVKRKFSRLLLSMPFVALFLVAFCFTVFAKEANAQSITLNLKNAAVEQVFKAIQKQTDYGFIYTNSQLEGTRPVSINVRNEKLERVLDIVLKDQPITYTLSNTVIIIKQRSSGIASVNSGWQSIDGSEIEVNGKVVNESGLPVEGVTVSVKGTMVSATTNANGEFSLSTIDKDAVLVFTHVSMEAFELKVSGQKNIVVTLKAKVSVLSGVEIISTGFQEIPKERATGSFVHVDNKTLNQQTGPNILQRLDGIASGLTFKIGKEGANDGPPSRTNISIRGISTINGPTDPLIVLDNFIYDGDLNNINPNDIESVTILKDGAATSIYGAQGGNGVIVLTTKKGKFNQKLKVSFNSNVIVNEKIDFYSLPQIAVKDYIDVEQFLFSRGYYDDIIYNSFPPYPALTPAVEVFQQRREGLIDAGDSSNLINSLKQMDTRQDYDRFFNKRYVLQQYSLALSGGSEKVSWLVSGAYDNTQLSNNLMNERINIRFSNAIKPMKNLQVRLGVYYTTNRVEGSQFPEFGSVTVNRKRVPYLTFSQNSIPSPVFSQYRQSYLDTLAQGHLLDWYYYPLEDYKFSSLSNDRNDMTANVNLNYQILTGLDLDVSYQYQRQQSASKNISERGSFYTRDLINTFTELTRDEITGEVINVAHNNLPMGDILTTSNHLIRSQNFRTQANYGRTWNDHAIFGIVGFQTRETITDGGVASTFYGYTEDPISYGTVDFRNPYPTVFGYYFSIPGAPTISGRQNYRFVSYFGNMSYTYKDRYTVSLSGRRDGSNIFGANTNDKWKPLWSAGVAWDLSKENFYKFDLIPNLKIRVTLGHSGNVDLRKTPYPIAIYSPSDPYTGYPYAGVGLLNDPSLKWEQTSQLNFGLDFSSRGHRISGTLEYYYKKSNDLYGEAPSDYTGGGSGTRIRNVADMMGQGVDIMIKTQNIKGKFNWSTMLLFNYNMNKVTNYFSPESERLSSLVSTVAGVGIVPVVGKPVYAFAAYKWGGLNVEGDPQGYLDGQLSTDYAAIFGESTIKSSSDNLIYIGSATPQYFGNISNEVSWKGFALSFNISYRLGYYFRRPSISYSSLYSNGIGHPDFEKRWKTTGDEMHTNVPAMVYTDHPSFGMRDYFYNFSEINVKRADNIRLQYINLIYNFGGNILKIPVDQIQFYCNVSNLGILWKAHDEDIDPDYVNVFTPVKSFTIGLRANF